MSKIVLTLEQIKELARFAEEEGQPSYAITTGTIPAFEAEDGEMVEEYNRPAEVAQLNIARACGNCMLRLA
ncbi:TPA: hypothetical protein ACGD7V_000888 [Serratia marcescens]|nr:hypothetical protein SMKC073_06120 [Serratia marcescens]BEN81788.1 hypothetical protein SMKC103_06120 [Serratia marcescens]